MSRLRLETERLILRPPTLEDAAAIHAFCDDPEIARWTVGVPTPYSVELAEQWVHDCAAGLDAETKYAFLICRRDDGAVMGDTVLTLDTRDHRAELGCILGRDHRGQGYALEATREMVRFGFESLSLNKIYAGVWTNNEPSVRLLEKLGFTREGVLRRHDFKWGRYQDDARYGLLRSEWKGQ